MSSFASCRSTATIGSAPASARPITTDRPTPPQPITTTLEPGSTAGGVDHRANAGGDAAADQRAHLGRQLGRHRHRRRGGHHGPLAERADRQVRAHRLAAGPAQPRRPVAHQAGRPRASAGRSTAGPRGSGALAARRVPATAPRGRRRRHRATPSPTASTTPQPSWPSTIGGSLGPLAHHHVQVGVAEARRLHPHRTSPARGSSTSSVSSSSGRFDAREHGRPHASTARCATARPGRLRRFSVPPAGAATFCRCRHSTNTAADEREGGDRPRLPGRDRAQHGQRTRPTIDATET